MQIELTTEDAYRMAAGLADVFEGLGLTLEAFQLRLLAPCECKFHNCTNHATFIASGRTRQGDCVTGRFCSEHFPQVVAANHPEYVVDCPNCGCKFGVN